MNINKIHNDQINFIGSFTTEDQNALKKVNFPLPHTIASYEAKEIDGKRVSRAEDIANRYQEAVKDTDEYNKEYKSAKRSSPLKRLAAFLITAATITAIVVGGLYCSPFVAIGGGIAYFIGSVIYAEKRKYPHMQSIAGLIYLFVPLYDPIFGKPFLGNCRKDHLSVDAVDKEKTHLLKNNEFLLEKKNDIKKEINKQLCTLKVEQEVLQKQENKLREDLEESFQNGTENPDLKIAKYQEGKIALEPLQKSLQEKTELIENYKNVLEKLKEVEKD